MKDFKKLEVWQRGIKIVALAYRLTKLLPNVEKFNLTSQTNRSAVSIPSNIAEGSSRRSEKDYFRFLEIALGSCFELETQIIILNVLSFVKEGHTQEILEQIESEEKQLFVLMNLLQK
jgi:four helix bundle protein